MTSTRFFGKAKVSEFVKFKNFDASFLTVYAPLCLFPWPAILAGPAINKKNPLRGLEMLSSFFIFFLFYLGD